MSVFGGEADIGLTIANSISCNRSLCSLGTECNSILETARGHLEKLLPLAIADSSGVNVNESERERSGIIRGQFYGVWRGGAIFRGAREFMTLLAGGAVACLRP